MNDKTNTLATRNSELPEAMQQRQRRQAAAKNAQD
jgi:phosphoglycerate-specific signal transduction histidine kinase